jgi:hypothetical protein
VGKREKERERKMIILLRMGEIIKEKMEKGIKINIVMNKKK